jgi:hypothetical protein
MSSTPVTPIKPILPVTPVVGPVLGTPIAGIPVTGIAASTPLSPTNPTVTTETPSVTVTVPNTSGTVTFQLIVTDNLGVASAPVTQTVTIQGAPIAVLKATPAVVAAGKTITLDASGSTAAAPGTVASYAFTLEPTATTQIK